MANQWFRMYSEFANDAKVQMMPEAMQRRLVMLFCLRCSDVTVTLSDDEMAFQLRISEAECVETKALFMRKGFIDSAWNIVNWEKRQFASDSSAARTRAYRDRMRDALVTSQVTERDALEQNRTDTDKNPPNPPAGGNAPEIAKGQKPKRTAKIGLDAFLQTCREQGEKPIPADDAVFGYADRIGLPAEFVALAWRWFKSRYGDKRQAGVRGWRQTFRNAVEGNWPKFWFADDAGRWQLTTAGRQAQIAADADFSAEEAA